MKVATVEAQVDVVERQRLELLQLEQKHRDQARALEGRQRAQLLRLERSHVLEIAALWKAQGRRLGPGLLSILKGGQS